MVNFVVIFSRPY